MDNETAKTKISEALEAKKAGVPTVQYRLRDWGISRQRYWGAPVPVIYCEGCGVVLVPEKDLPVELPENVPLKGVQGNPLDKISSFVDVPCPQCGKKARRETDTMDTFVESSWYYARYVSPKWVESPFSKKAADQWLPVDTYIGGIEHACMHLLYSRFFHKVLRDWNLLSGDEPFTRLLSQGMVIKDGAKMSKSKGNVVSLTSILDRYGADTGRLFSLFAAPPEKDLDWNEKGVEGCFRFVGRIWRLAHQFQSVMEAPALPEEGLIFNDRLSKVRKKTHWTVWKVTSDLEEVKFNTAIAATMELVNEMYGALAENEQAFQGAAGSFVVREAMHSLLLCLSPFVPHLCEELWAAMGNKTLISEATWPSHRADLLVQGTFLLVIQINGKVREKVELAKGLSEAEIRKQVLDLPKIRPYVEGKTVRQFIYVPERIVNLVV